MSDDELLDELERERGFAARLGYLIFAQPMEKAAARIRELKAAYNNMCDYCCELERERDALWQAIDNIDTSDPQLARRACERFGLDIDKAAISAARPERQQGE